MKKILLSPRIFEELEYYGHGGRQTAFYDKNKPDVIVKKPKTNTVFSKYILEIYEFMQKYPTFFAKIYNITPKEIKQEKLDDKKFMDDFREMANDFKKFPEITNEIKSSYQKEEDESLFSLILYSFDFLKPFTIQLPTNSFRFIKKLKNFLNELNKLEDLSPNLFDLHPLQFGYDENNNIKMFDV